MNVKNKSIIKKLINNLEYNRIINYIDAQSASKTLIDLALNILDIHGASINNYTEATTIKENLTVIATSILKDLFRNCIESRELIYKSILNAINEIDYNESAEKDSTVFIG